MMNIPYPNLQGNPEEQLIQLRRYLYQIVDLLNHNFNSLETDLKSNTEILTKITEEKTE